MKYLFLVYVFTLILLYLIELNIIHIDINYVNYKIINNMKYRLNESKYTKFVDKLQFKEYCKSKGVDTFKTLKIYDQKDYDKINIKGLPDKFIIKSNKGSGRNFIVNNEEQRNKLINMINQNPNPNIKSDKHISQWGDMYSYLKEPQYEYTKPKIFIEELIEPIPQDIKLFYLNKKLIFIKIYIYISNGHKTKYYDENRNILNIKQSFDKYNGKTIIDNMSDNKFKELKSVGDRLASGVDLDLDLFRVDIYYVNDKFYGCEITLSPDGGNSPLKYI